MEHGPNTDLKDQKGKRQRTANHAEYANHRKDQDNSRGGAESAEEKTQPPNANNLTAGRQKRLTA